MSKDVNSNVLEDQHRQSQFGWSFEFYEQWTCQRTKEVRRCCEAFRWRRQSTRICSHKKPFFFKSSNLNFKWPNFGNFLNSLVAFFGFSQANRHFGGGGVMNHRRSSSNQNRLPVDVGRGHVTGTRATIVRNAFFGMVPFSPEATVCWTDIGKLVCWKSLDKSYTRYPKVRFAHLPSSRMARWFLHCWNHQVQPWL